MHKFAKKFCKSVLVRKINVRQAENEVDECQIKCYIDTSICEGYKERRKKMKRLIALLLAVVMVLAFSGCEAPDDGVYTVGICQYMPHPALNQATEGFKDALKDAFGENVKFVEENATGEISNCVSIVNSLVSSKVDLIMANATPAVQAAANATRTIPVLGTSVTEYGVALGIPDFSGVVGTNVSGTSDLASLDKQAAMILQWRPDVKKVGLLYCSSEANSQYQVDEVQKYLEASNVECKQFSFTDSNDMSAVVQDAANWSDAIYVPTDNTVADNAGIIDGICRPAGVPVFAGEEGICAACGVATLSISYYELGYTTGQMAVKVLKGEADISQMEIEYAPSETPKYNSEICQALGIEPVDGYIPIG